MAQLEKEASSMRSQSESQVAQLKKEITKIKKVNWHNIDVLFTALPNGEAQKIVKIIPTHTKLIDLSADFRLNDFKLYKKWYGINHKCKKMLKDSLYAVTEFSRKYLSRYKIISCPGCYPTSIQIPLIPLIEKKMINIKNITIDSKSGYSGAGKKIKNKFKFKNLFNSVSAYGIGSHRHMAEIDQELSKISKSKIKVTFTPHLIPMFRGILSTIYLETRNNFDAKKIYKYLKNYHKKNFFVKIEWVGQTHYHKEMDEISQNNIQYLRRMSCFFDFYHLKKMPKFLKLRSTLQ